LNFSFTSFFIELFDIEFFQFFIRILIFFFNEMSSQQPPQSIQPPSLPPSLSVTTSPPVRTNWHRDHVRALINVRRDTNSVSFIHIFISIKSKKIYQSLKINISFFAEYLLYLYFIRYFFIFLVVLVNARERKSTLLD
jgi:hypothetical protein